MSVYNTTIYFIYFKIVYRQGDMFRPLLGRTHVFYNLYSTSKTFSKHLGSHNAFL